MNIRKGVCVPKLSVFLATTLGIAFCFTACTPAVSPLPDFTATPAATMEVATLAPTVTRLPILTRTPDPNIFTLTSPVFDDNGPIPTKHTCAGPNVSPALAWRNPPAGTASFVLIVEDPDAIKVAGTVWDHWVLFNLPADLRSLETGAPAPKGSVEGLTSGGKMGYEGPCPPQGNSHHYHFYLYALDIQLKIKAGATKKLVLETLQGHILGRAELVGLYPFK
jgi:Raf kinase inhibitor-like YbhB/YbcL family protein